DGDPPSLLAGEAGTGPDFGEHLVDHHVGDVVVTLARRGPTCDLGEHLGTAFPPLAARRGTRLPTLAHVPSRYSISARTNASTSVACCSTIACAAGSLSTSSRFSRMPCTTSSPASSALISGSWGATIGVGSPY